MEYLIPVALVILLVGGFVTFVAFYSASASGTGRLERAPQAEPAPVSERLADRSF